MKLVKTGTNQWPNQHQTFTETIKESGLICANNSCENKIENIRKYFVGFNNRKSLYIELLNCYAKNMNCKSSIVDRLWSIAKYPAYPAFCSNHQWNNS